MDIGTLTARVRVKGLWKLTWACFLLKLMPKEIGLTLEVR